jgi:hypothetical protein
MWRFLQKVEKEEGARREQREPDEDLFRGSFLDTGGEKKRLVTIQVRYHDIVFTNETIEVSPKMECLIDQDKLQNLQYYVPYVQVFIRPYLPRVDNKPGYQIVLPEKDKWVDYSWVNFEHKSNSKKEEKNPFSISSWVRQLIMYGTSKKKKRSKKKEKRMWSMIPSKTSYSFVLQKKPLLSKNLERQKPKVNVKFPKRGTLFQPHYRKDCSQKQIRHKTKKTH